MKKSKILAAIISFFFLVISSCSLNSSSSNETSSPSNSGSATLTVSASYIGKPLIVDAGSSVKRVIISNTSSAGGKGVYLAKVNNDYSQSISYDKIRYVTSTSGITQTTSAAKMDLSNLEFDSEDSVSYDEFGTGCLTPDLEKDMDWSVFPDYSNKERLLFQADAGAASCNYVGATKTLKLLYYVNSSRQNTYSIDCEVVAVDDTAKILIWAPCATDSYTLSSSETSFKSDTTVSSSDSKLNGKTWKDYYISYFKDIYNLDRTVFGEESEYTGSDTYGYTNLVFFNMDKYYTYGVRGYFYGIDYYPTTKYSNSNQGKYLYINVNPAVKTTCVENSSVVDTYEIITATMAHEFMHMIQFNQKYLKHGISCTTAFGEMMGEIAKDLIVDYMNPQRSECVWNRFEDFNQTYTYAGTTGYSNYAVYYSTNYSFGAWLCRNFGGVKLARNFIQNAYNSDNAIVHAVNSVNGTSYTMTDLIKLYAAAITVSNSDYDYPLNKASDSQNDIVCSASLLSSGSDYSYPLLAINIFDLGTTLDRSSLGLSTTDRYLQGPYLYNAYGTLPSLGTIASGITTNGALLTYHGIHLCKIGTIDNDTDSITIDFTENGASNLQMYVIIGDNRLAKGE